MLDLIPATVRRQLMWTMGDAGLALDSYSMSCTALDDSGNRVESYLAERIFIVVTTASKVRPEVARTIRDVLVWAHLEDVEVSQLGHAGTSGAAGDQADDQAPARYTIHGSLRGQLPAVDEKPPVSVGAPASGWQVVKAITPRARADDEDDDIPENISPERTQAIEAGKAKAAARAQLMRKSGHVRGRAPL
jgi:hypothetical protein